MPWILRVVPFLQSALFEVPDEISVTPCTASLRPAVSPAGNSACTLVAKAEPTVRRWGIVCRARLETNWLAGVEMAGDSLYGCWNPALLLVHS